MIKGDKVFREVEQNCWDTSVRMKEMDMTEVSVQVLSTIPVLFNYWAKPQDGLETARFFNDHIAQSCQLHPDRFIGLGTLPLQDIDLSIKELERCMQSLQLAGIEIGSNINGKNLSDPYFFPLWEAAERLNCSIFVHPWEMMGEQQMQKYWLPWLVGMPAETSLAICSMIFGGIFEKLPSLRVAFAHGGGSFPSTIGRIEHGFNCRPDLVAVDNPINPRKYLSKFWLDSLVHDQKMLEFVVDLMGAEKIALGSDYPFPLGENKPGELIRNSSFSDTVKENLLFGAALKWLNLEKNLFI
jgi:aminocarboxymuconate-semialdehyde decarboxylase